MDTRGRLITTLSRVARQPKPAPDLEQPAAPELGAGPATAPGDAEQAASLTVPPEQVAESPGISEDSPPTDAAEAEAATVESATEPVPFRRRPASRRARRRPLRPRWQRASARARLRRPASRR